MSDLNLDAALHALSVWALPVLFAITLHEAAHGFVAWQRGDPTAKMLGRVTFNPLRHIDLWGTIIIPAMLLLARAPFLFGWAKPVPVNFGRLRNPRRDMVWVAAAGPGINFVIAYVSALALHLPPVMPQPMGTWVGENLVNSVLINLVLAVFNMIPLPPLDGGRVAVGLLPRRIAYPLARLEPMGFPIIITLLFLLPWLGSVLGLQLNVFRWLVGVPVDFLFNLIAAASGHG